MSFLRKYFPGMPISGPLFIAAVACGTDVQGAAPVATLTPEQ